MKKASRVFRARPTIWNITTQHERYPKARKGLVICRQCHNIFLQKSWHHADSARLRSPRRSAKASFTLCPACTMIANKLFEGEILVRNLPTERNAELLRLVAGYGTRATKADPQDRIIEIRKQAGGYRITTTENQLAVRLAKKIRDAFNKVDLRIAYSKEPHQVARVQVLFPSRR